MSAVASWSYTARATLWALQRRDGRSGTLTFATPVAIACDYSEEQRRERDAAGEEFLTRLTLFTERAGIKQGDRIMLGDATTVVDPVTIGALEVRAVRRDADTFDRVADDYRVVS